MAILITGGAGFIGTHTCVELLNAGEEIVVVDNLINSKREALDGVKKITGKDFPFYENDILDESALNRIFEQNNITSCIHFAGLKAVGESVEKPLEYYHNNITGTLILLKVMNRFNVRQIVFSSSATVYGMPKEVPIKEDFPLSTTNPYGSTKLYIEQILKDLCVSDERWRVVLLRYFNPIGAHESGLIGEEPNGIPNNIMPRIIDVARGKMDSLTVFGDDYPTKDGTGVRDYIHVCDLAEGHVCAVQALTRIKGAHAYNLGTGNGYSVLEIIKTFEQANNVKINCHITPRRPGDVAECYADPQKAQKELDWTAKRGIIEMCRDAWRYASRR